MAARGRPAAFATSRASIPSATPPTPAASVPSAWRRVIGAQYKLLLLPECSWLEAILVLRSSSMTTLCSTARDDPRLHRGLPQGCRQSYYNLLSTRVQVGRDDAQREK